MIRSSTAVVKIAATLAILVALTWREHLALVAVATLVTALVTVSLGLLAGVTRLASIEVAATGLDRLCLAVSALAATFPLVIAAAALFGNWTAGLATVTAAAAAVWRWGPAVVPVRSSVTVPATVYVLAAAYVVWSVVNPFAHFSSASLVRELYTDAFQRFGVIYALAEHVPSSNPFVAGLPLRYYWFALAPMAAMLRIVSGDPFAVWKVVMTCQAFCFVVTAWWIAASVLKSHRGAWSACLLALVFASPEIVAHPRLGEALRALTFSASGVRDAAAMLTSVDPDHLVGVVVPHSDQLLMEDFLYVPQNAAAMVLLLIGVWLIAKHHWLAAAFVVAALVGTNTFFIIPAGAAIAVVLWLAVGIARATVGITWLLAWSIAWAWLCHIASGPDDGPPLTLGLLATIGVAFGCGWLWRRLEIASGPLAIGRSAALAAMLALAVAVASLALLRPAPVAVALLLNYSPAIVIGTGVLAWCVWRRALPALGPEAPVWIFLLLFGAVYYVTVAGLVLPFWKDLPAGTEAWMFRVGDAVNPFNFAHKVAKGTRLMWCLVAATATVPMLTWVARSRVRLVAVVVGSVLVLPVSAATSILRPLTYLRDAPVPEAPAAAFLGQAGASLATVVLVEDFRESRINQLAPVSTYFISSWSAESRSLSNAVGTWVDQYVPPRFSPITRAREATNAAIFSSPDPAPAIRALGRQTRLDYVLTRRRYELGTGFRMVVDWPGGYLYEVHADAQ